MITDSLKIIICELYHQVANIRNISEYRMALEKKAYIQITFPGYKIMLDEKLKMWNSICIFCQQYECLCNVCQRVHAGLSRVRETGENVSLPLVGGGLLVSRR